MLLLLLPVLCYFGVSLDEEEARWTEKEGERERERDREREREREREKCIGLVLYLTNNIMSNVRDCVSN